MRFFAGDRSGPSHRGEKAEEPLSSAPKALLDGASATVSFSRFFAMRRLRCAARNDYYFRSGFQQACRPAVSRTVKMSDKEGVARRASGEGVQTAVRLFPSVVPCRVFGTLCVTMILRNFRIVAGLRAIGRRIRWTWSESVFPAVLRGGDLFALPEKGRELADVLEAQLRGDLRNGAIRRGE